MEARDCKAEECLRNERFGCDFWPVVWCGDERSAVDEGGESTLRREVRRAALRRDSRESA